MLHMPTMKTEQQAFATHPGNVASSVWDDIRIDNVLPFRDSKEKTTKSTFILCNWM